MAGAEVHNTQDNLRSVTSFSDIVVSGRHKTYVRWSVVSDLSANSSDEVGEGQSEPVMELRRSANSAISPALRGNSFSTIGVTICYICADECVDELRTEGNWT